jgi:hypothetical protein
MLLLVPRCIPSTLLYYNCIYIHVIPCTYIQDTTNQEATICTPEQGHMDVMDNANNVANDDSDDDREFTDDEDCFVMMTHNHDVTENSHQICCNEGFFHTLC